MKRIHLCTLLVLFFTALASAQTREVVIKGSEVRTITSTLVKGQVYELQILLPSGYNPSKKYPVVYILDSQWDFPLVQALYGQQYYDGFIPELILVGVLWGGNNPNADSLRARDFTPTNEKRILQSGGAGNFVAFMKNELFPFIESNYRAESNHRTLMGCSLGGLFALYTLFSQPDLFSNYIAASPAFGWDNEVIYQYEKKYFEQQRGTPARLYMTIGGVEKSVPEFEKLTKYLVSRDYKTLKIESDILKNTGHSGTKGEGFARGLQFAFQRNEINPDQSILRSYAGVYQFADNATVDVTVENAKLVLHLSKNNTFELKAENNADFYSTAEFLKIHFITAAGIADGFQLERYGHVQAAKKIK